MSGLRRAVAFVLTELAWRIAPADARYFDEDDETVSPDAWAGMLVLHAEAIHGCTHTDQARAELGMLGPRGKPAV